MSNDKVQSIMALVEDYGNALSGRDDLYQYDPRDELEEAKRRVIAVRSALESAIREAIAAPGVAQPVARILHWNGPKHMGVPHGGICARTFGEFPKGAGENGGYWKEGAPLYLASPTTEQHIQLHDPVTIKGGPAE